MMGEGRKGKNKVTFIAEVSMIFWRAQCQSAARLGEQGLLGLKVLSDRPPACSAICMFSCLHFPISLSLSACYAHTHTYTHTHGKHTHSRRRLPIKVHQASTVHVPLL